MCLELEATTSNVFFQAGLCGVTLGSHFQPSVHTLMITQVVSQLALVYPTLKPRRSVAICPFAHSCSAQTVYAKYSDYCLVKYRITQVLF